MYFHNENKYLGTYMEGVFGGGRRGDHTPVMETVPVHGISNSKKHKR